MVFIGPHGGVCEHVTASAAAAGVRIDCVTDGALADGSADLAAPAVFLQHLRGDITDRLDKALVAAQATGTQVFALSAGAGASLPGLTQARTVIEDPVIIGDYGSAEPARLAHLLMFVRAKYLKIGPMPDPVESAPVQGLFHPDAPQRFSTLAAYTAWARAHGRADTSKPLIAVAVHALHLTLQQPAVVAALIREVEKQGGRAVAIVDGNPIYRDLLLSLGPDAVLHTCHSGDDLDLRLKLGAPHLHSIFFREQSIAEWQASEVGISPHEIAFHVTGQELIGGIEPQVVAGTLMGKGSSEAFTPIPERVEHLVRRGLAWARLKRLANRDKQIAVVYYDRDQGKAELMRGSATGQMLNGPKSLLRVLDRMARDGYQLGDPPRDEETLLDLMRDHGRRIGAWNPAAVDRLATSGHAALVPLSQYLPWYMAHVPADRRAEVEARWGPPPGKLMVWRGGAEPMIVIPKVQLGNVTLLPQPLRGEADDPQLLHDTKVPPPHSFLATYFWLDGGLKANAVVHFGTHGSEFGLPGRGVGLSARDWPDIIMGGLPNLTVWVINNLGESVPARRRAYAVLIGHLVPPSGRAGLSDELENLHAEIERWRNLEPGTLRSRFQDELSKQIRALRLDAEVARLDTPTAAANTVAPIADAPAKDAPAKDAPAKEAPAKEAPLSDAVITAVDLYLHTLAEETVHTELHVLGQAPSDDKLAAYLALCLGARFSRAIAPLLPASAPAKGDTAETAHEKSAAATAAVEQIATLVLKQKLSPEDALKAIGAKAPRPLPTPVRDGFEQLDLLVKGFANTHQEIDLLMTGLSGGFVPPGPGNSPVRNPAVVPTGRNFYVVNPEEIPARASWEVAATLVDDLLAGEKAKNGKWPEQVGFALNPFSSLQDYGVTEAQILRLIGVEPVWDVANRVQNFRLIPREELGRPRVDVFISIGGYYRDMLPTRMTLIDRAIRAAAASSEPDNPLAAANRTVSAKLRAGGMPAEQAEAQSQARIFGDPPGEYGDMTYYYLLERSGDWENLAELMQRYVKRQSHAYTDGAWGVSAQGAYEGHIEGTSVVLRAWSDATRSPLNNKYMWLRGGSLAAAVEHVTGKRPQYLLTDVRDNDRARLVSSEDAVRADTRVRLFNKAFIEGMMKEGYAGADQLAVHVSNTLGWQIFRPDAVDDGVWNEIVATYVRDRHNLGLKAFFAAQNPHAFQDLTATVLEAARKGYWKADPQTLAEVSRAYAESVVAHGPNGALRDGPNSKLTAAVAAALEGTGLASDAALAKALVKAMAAERAAPGEAVVAAEPSAAPAPTPTNQPTPAEAKPAEGQPAQPNAERAEVEGVALEPSEPSSPSRLPWIIGAAVLVLLGLGFARGRRGGGA